MSGPDTRLDPARHARIFSDGVLPESDYPFATRQTLPKAIILGGQPGAGKGRLARIARTELADDVVVVDPDALRDFHPDIQTFRQVHPYTWSGDTHPDASAWADELLEATIEGRKNLIFDTTLSNGPWSAELINDLQAKGYDVEVRVVAAHKLESELGVDRRFTQRFDADGYARHVPSAARDAIYDKLPESLDVIHANTTTPIRIFNRDGQLLYDSPRSPQTPGAALQLARDAQLANFRITHELRNGYRDQLNWHADLPETLPGKVDAQTATNLLEQERAGDIMGTLEHSGKEAFRVDHEVRIRPRVRAGSALGIAGVALEAYDGAETLRTTQRLRGEGNDTAADSGVVHFGARSVGGLAGAGLGGSLGAIATAETGPGLLIGGAIGGLVGAVAGEKLAAWSDNRSIYRQDDGLGHRWSHNPDRPELGWQRPVQVDASTDGRDNPEQQMMVAPPALANQLNYQATSRSVELILGSPPAQQSPTHQPADKQRDGHSFAVVDNWVRGEDTVWRREVLVGYVDRVRQTRTDIASPERAAELEQAMRQALDNNVAHSPMAIAARYETLYQANGWAAHGPVPPAVQHARADLNSLVASDGNRYQRDADGQWMHDGMIYDSAAAGALRDELEATRNRLSASLAPPNEAQPPAPAPISADQRLRDAVNSSYREVGIQLDQAQLQLRFEAVRTTHRAEGLEGASGVALVLQRDEQRRYSLDSPIATLRPDKHGFYKPVAQTDADDFRQAAFDALLHPSAAEQRHPLFTQALQHLQRLGPQVAGYQEPEQLRNMAGALAFESHRYQMKDIQDVYPHNGQLIASGPTGFGRQTYAPIEPQAAAQQPAEHSLQQLSAREQQQAQEQLVREQQESVARVARSM